MRSRIPALVIILPFLISACSSHALQVTIVDGQNSYLFNTTSTTPKELLEKGKVYLGPHDRILFQGEAVPQDAPLTGSDTITLTVRRAVDVAIHTPEGDRAVETSALTVGEALIENGIPFTEDDYVAPPANTPIQGPLEIIFRPAVPLTILVDGSEISIQSSASSVGEALAWAGIPLEGLDESIPAEDSPLPEDGKIRISRIVEAISLTEKEIPFEMRTELSAELEIDQQALLQGGEPGLAVTKMRTRYEDGKQVSNVTENETIIRPPQDRVQGIGTKIVIRTATIGSETIEYWRVLTLNATSYSPCRSMTPSGACSYGTASGMKAGYGVVAMEYHWYLLFGFEHLFIPGYGFAVVGDNGGVNLSSNYWIDLGYDDDNYVPWSEPVTVYFLTPVPDNPGYILP
jgi:uncharacterized protein YabE (DUF348 family)